MNITTEIHKAFSDIKFYEKTHKYVLPNEPEIEFISGTKFVSFFHKEFDMENMAQKYATKNGLLKEDVINLWSFKGLFARTKGTLAHSFAENLWQGKYFEQDYSKFDSELLEKGLKESSEKCYQLVQNFYDATKDKIVPIRLELPIYDKELRLSGMVDFLGYSIKHDEIIIIDYKTSAEIDFKAKYGGRMNHPITYLPECNWIEYSIQLNLYQYIIERNTSLKIGRKYLIHIHEDLDNYSIIECKEMQDVIPALVEEFNKHRTDDRPNQKRNKRKGRGDSHSFV